MVRDELKADATDPHDFIRRELALRAVYETGFGIYPHGSSPTPKPFALQAAHPKEDYLPYSTMARDYEKFIEVGVYAKTGESMAEFFRRPRHEVEMILSMIRASNQKESGEAERLRQEMARQNQPGNQK